MNPSTINTFQHNHNFAPQNPTGEKRTLWVLWLTLITMIVEIIAGMKFSSMALLADGWHMGTHVAAFSITLFAYRYARKHANNRTFSFGTGKVSVLAGFTSAVALAMVALIMMIESLFRLIHPENIQFNQAIMVAIIGLVINVISVFLLHGHGHHHHHDHEHDHHHDHNENHHHHEHHDHNLTAAYLHVLADALTSLLAIVALLFGKYMGLNWLDAVMGVVGAIIITRWAWGLMKQTSPILLDSSINEKYQQQLIDTLTSEPETQVSDIHIWKISADHFAAIISVVTPTPKEASYYKQRLAKYDKIAHITIEVNQIETING